MNRRDFVAALAEHLDTDKRSADAALQGFVDIVSGHIASEIEAGRILPLNPVPTATALVWMTERYLMLSLGREPLTPTDVVFDALWTIWASFSANGRVYAGDDDGSHVIMALCPKGGAGKAMARFRKVGGDWKFVLFLEK